MSSNTIYLFYKDNKIIFCVNCNRYKFFFLINQNYYKGIFEFVVFYALFVSCFCSKIELYVFSFITCAHITLINRLVKTVYFCCYSRAKITYYLVLITRKRRKNSVGLWRKKIFSPNTYVEETWKRFVAISMTYKFYGEKMILSRANCVHIF